MRFGPEIAYRFSAGNGTIVEPRAKAEAIWNFTESATGLTTIDPAVGTDAWRGKVELGLRLSNLPGQVLDFSASYDGIGSGDYRAISGMAVLRFPMN